MKNVCLIGAGNIGSRHLQGLKKVTFPLNIEVVDPFKESLATAQQRYKEIESSTNHKIVFLSKLEKISKKIDLVIIATNSNIRANIIQELLRQAEVKYLILEKLLFQKPSDYLNIQSLLKSNNVKAWVNCSMRTTPFYYNLKDIIKNKPIQYIVNGSQFGLVTNAIHYIDHMVHLTGCNEFNLDTTLLEKKPIASKRKGFLELNGTLNIHFKNGSFGSLTCYSDGNAPILVQIFCESFRCISKETEKTAWISGVNNWQWKQVAKTILYQSEMTNIITDQLIKKGDCNLTPYDDSMKIHLQLLEGLLNFLNQNSKKKYTIYPFT